MFNFKVIATRAGKAVYEHNMINEGDKILICFSGGKDSFALVNVLRYFKKKYPINFELKILVVNPGFDTDFQERIVVLLDSLGFDYEILNSEISSVLIEQSKIKPLNPCFMCSRLRRGIIYNYAIENGFNKIALGHTLDDAIETHLMNFFYSSKTSFLKPKYLAENGKVEVIRPLIYVEENLIVDFMNNENFVPVKIVCPMRKEDSKRLFFKNLISEMYKQNPKIKENAYHAMKNTCNLNSWEK